MSILNYFKMDDELADVVQNERVILDPVEEEVKERNRLGMRWQCPNCDYKCLKESCLKKHMMTHTGERPYKCTICDYASI